MASSTATIHRILSSSHCAQFHRDGFLALHYVWSQGAVTEVRHLIDGLFESADRVCGPLPNF